MSMDLPTGLLASLGGVVVIAGIYLLVRRFLRGRSVLHERMAAPGEPERESPERDAEATPGNGEPEPEPERSIDFGRGGRRGIDLGRRELAMNGGDSPPPEPVQFTVYHPEELVPERWAKLLAYVHLAGARDAVERDRERLLAAEPGEHRARSEDAVVPIRRESLIRVVPELPGCRFNPPEASVLWLEDFHGVEFRVQAHPGVAGFAAGRAVNGRVSFYVESLLVGEVPIWALIAEGGGAGAPRETPLDRSGSARAYDRVFASYSHRDGEIVEALGRAYRALGMEFLRDVEALRSGEQWNPRLLELIEGADVFQLYWSDHASRSRYVEQEWRHALAQGRERFVRPVYWRRPMPQPPRELGAIHFAFLPGYDGG